MKHNLRVLIGLPFLLAGCVLMLAGCLLLIAGVLLSKVALGTNPLSSWGAAS